MALFIMIIRKMVQNKWLVSALFLGLLISVALVSSMPIYSEAILSRMLVKDLESMQERRGVYPGSQYSKMFFLNEDLERKNGVYHTIDQFIAGEGSESFGIPVQRIVVDITSRTFKFRPELDPTPDSTRSVKSLSFRSFSDLESHIRVIDGKLPELHPVDGVYEVMVTPRGLSQLKAVVGHLYHIDDSRFEGKASVRIVGVFEKLEDDDPYFRDSDLSELTSSFVIRHETALQYVLKDGLFPISSAGWFLNLDYSKMELRHVELYSNTLKLIQSKLLSYVSYNQVAMEAPATDTIASYMKRAEQLRVLMWSLNVPVLIMLSFYMFMVSNLIADRQRNEIAVLRSRGAARWQIIASYAVESLLLCAIALGIGPLLGMLLTNVLGASNGFLEFVQRVRLPIRITEEAYGYGAIAAGVCFIITLTPIVFATRVSIVGHKQQMARMVKTPLWHKMFLDVLALGLAIYGLYTFRKRLEDLQALGLNADDLNIDPLQFIVPALFIIGAGLMLLRVYPWLLRLIHWIGKRWWPPSLYATLIQVGRSSSQYQFLMIFLVMTIATGVFSASAARTINSNTEDRIRYGNGADIVLTSEWRNDKPPEGNPMEAAMSGSSTLTQPQQVINYLEPAYEPFQSLPGVEHTAKVFTKKVSFSANEAYGEATLFGIDTDEFGMTTWFRDSLLDYPLNDYLNLIASDSRAVLISTTLAEQKNVKVGDSIWVGWNDVPQQPFIVYGIVDYFPTFNPNPPAGSVNTNAQSGGGNAPMLIVGHLPRIQVQLALEPYSVWMKLSEDASIADFYAAIQESKLNVTSMTNTREQLINAKNDPFLLALNGILTLGFVLSIIVSFIGFLLYWVLSLRGRTLQNGILRAIGLSLRQLISMLGAEQLLTSGVAVIIGIFVGNLASFLYVPNFQIAFNPSSLVPPFKVVFSNEDLARIYVMVGFMLAVGLGILAYMLSRMRIHQAIKLGED